jgi:hypothetical protein
MVTQSEGLGQTQSWVLGLMGLLLVADQYIGNKRSHGMKYNRF